MAKIYGKAGKSARMIADNRLWIRRTLLLISIGAVLLIMWMILNTSFTVKGIASVIFSLLAIAALKWIEHTTIQTDDELHMLTCNANRGARGEEAIATLLRTLPDDYSVFHDLEKIAGDIDHIVVGPTGLFVIETKAHGGKVHAEGNQVLLKGRLPEKDFIAQSWRNAYWVRDVLKNTAEINIKVKPILVFTNAFVTVRDPVKGVRVINKKFLVETIIRDPRTDFPIARVVDILKQKLGSE